MGHLKSTFSSSHFSTVTLFIYLQGFERQRDQGAPVGDIFKSPFLANTVSERSTISLFFYTNDPEVSKYLFWHLRSGGRGVVERGWTVDWLPVVWLHLFKLSIFRSLRILFFSHNPLSPYTLEAIILSSGSSFHLFPLRYICFAFRLYQRYCVYYIVLINSHEDIFRYISGHAVLDEDTIKIEQKCTRFF